MPASTSHPATDRPRPPLLTAVGVLVLVEAVILVGAAGYVLHGLLTEPATESVAAVFLVVMALAFAAGVAFCAHGLLGRTGWARSPVIVWQLLQLAAGLPAFSGGNVLVGLLLVGTAVLVLVGLFVPSVAAEVSRH